MISKIIHYCWFGGNPLPPLALECIASWRKYLPDYEIWMWVESAVSDDGLVVSESQVSDERLVVNGADKVMTFDVNIIPYTVDAYRMKKYAYVSDYARFWIMYKYGGIYFDTDVEVIRPMDDIIEECSQIKDQSSRGSRIKDQKVQGSKGSRCGFMGFEMDPDGDNTPGKYAPRFSFAVNPGLGFGMEPQHPFIKMMMEHYQTLKFEVPPADISWYKTIVAYTTEKLCEMGLKNAQGIQTLVSDDGLVVSDKVSDEGLEVSGENSNHSTLTTNRSTITIYPSEYFAPINAISRRLHITENTRTIHRYMASWENSDVKVMGYRLWVKEFVKRCIPEWVYFVHNKIKRRRYKIR